MINAKTRIGKGLALLIAVLMCIGMMPALGSVLPQADAATPGAYPYKLIAKVYDNLTMDATMNFTIYGTTVNGTGSEVEIASYRWDKNVSTDEEYTIMEGTTANGVFPTRVHITDDNVQYWAVCSLGYHLVLEVNGTAVNMTGTVNSSDMGNGKVDVGSGTEANFYVKTNSGVKRNKWDVTYNVTDRPAPASIDLTGGSSVLTANAPGKGNASTADFAAAIYDQFGVRWGATAVQWSVSTIPGTTVSVSSASGDTSKVVVTPFSANSTIKDVTLVATCSYGSASVLDERVITIRPTYHVSYDFRGAAAPSGATTGEDIVNTSAHIDYIIYTIPTGNRNIERAGYSFYGWSTSSTSNSGETETIRIGVNDTLYAIWSPNSYYIRFFGNGSTSGSMSNQTLTYGIDANLRANSYARNFNVIYKTNGGTVIDTDKVTSDFLGWSRSSAGTVSFTDKQSVVNLTNLPNNPVYLYAVWQDNSIVLPSTTKEGYAFGGWYSDSEYTQFVGNAGDSITVSEETTLWAKWGCLHATRTELVGKEPTCTANGIKYLTCPSCGDVITETLPAIGHAYGNWIYSKNTDTHSKVCANDATHVITESCTYNVTVNAEANCTAGGSATYTCTICGGTKTENTAALGHTSGTPVTENETAATCKKDGGYDTVIYCSVCGVELSRTHSVIGKLAHTVVEIPAVETTSCLTEGFSAGSQCSVCNEYIVAPVSTGYGAHNPATTPGYAPTCTKVGKTDGVSCSVCGTVISAQTTIPVVDHTPGEAVKENVVAPTCQRGGSYYSVVYCSVCEKKLSSTKLTTEKVAHTPVEIPAVAAADCQTEGFTSGVKCSECNEVLTEPVSTGYGDHVPGTVNVKAASCSAEGYTGDSVCTLCGTVLNKGESIAKTAHEIVTAPGYGSTCISKGYSDARVCINCGWYEVPHTELPLAAHTAGRTENQNETAGTCTVKGSYEKVTFCSVCGDEMARETVETEYAAHTPGDEVTENEKAGNCVTPGTAEKAVYCTVCSKELSRTTVNTVLGDHTAGAAKKEHTTPATCYSTGVYEEAVYCTICSKELSRDYKSIPKTSHADSNGDGVCDACGYDMSSSCSHMCHQGGFMGFIWKLVNIFNKLFKINQTCSCGKAHW